MNTVSKRTFSVLLSLLLAAAGVPVQADSAAGAPRIFIISDSIPDETLTLIACQLDDALCEKVTGRMLPIVYGTADAAGDGDYVLCLDPAAGIPAEGFRITVRDTTVTVTASDPDGLFGGCRALIKQLLVKADVIVENMGSVYPEIVENREQIDVSKRFEKRPKPSLRAIAEFEEAQIYYENIKDENNF